MCQSDAMLPLLIYIHGFNSSPLSQKAEKTRRYILEHRLPIDFMAPALPDCPDDVYDTLRALIQQQGSRTMALIGSSMGGFFATVLAAEFDLFAVLVNPAVMPHRLIRAYLGDNINPYTGAHYRLTERHLQTLKNLTPPQPLHPHKLWLLVQTGDETLDYRDAVEYYRDCPQRIIDGGNHRFENFAQEIPAILAFLRLPTTHSGTSE